MNRIFISLCWIVGAVGIGHSAYAAREAKISEMSAEVFEAPDDSSSVLEVRKEKEAVKVSDKDKEGWHKIKLKRARDGFKFGWIRKDVLSFDESGDSEEESESPRKGKSRGAKSMSAMLAYEAIGKAPLLEFGANVDPDWRISLRAGISKYTQSVAGTVSNYEAKGREVFALVEYRVHSAAKYSLGIAAGPGVSMSTTLTDKTTVGSPVSPSFTALGFMGKGTLRYYLSPSFALHGEVGMRYFTKSNVLVGTNIVNLSLNSIVAAVGLAYEF